MTPDRASVQLYRLTLDEATLAAERTCEHQANVYSEATLAVNLDAHSKVVYERPANACDEATLAAKLDARGEATYERLTITYGEATLDQV